MSNKFFVFIGLISFVGIGVAAIRPPQPLHENLQIIPKDISEEKLDSIMQTYNKALGVTCSFCHDPINGDNENLNFATDLNPMKKDARKMIKLTMELNEKYFYYDSTRQPFFLNVITCNTCHKGDPFPES